MSGKWKVLLVGSSGFIGSRLVSAWNPAQLTATFCSRPVAGAIHYDVAHERLADRFFLRGHEYTHVILALGVTKLEQCARQSAHAFAINVAGTMRAIADAVDAGIQPIFLSSDGVFDGTRGPRTEDELPYPTLSYGRQKVEVETYLSRLASPWTIVRLSKVVGSLVDERNLLWQWLLQLERSQVINCATDQMLSPIDVGDVRRALQFVLETSATGIFHAAGSDIVTRYELLQLLLKHAPEHLRQKASIRQCLLGEIPCAEPLPVNCSLSNVKLKTASGISPRSMDDVCAELCRNVFSQPSRNLRRLETAEHRMLSRI